MSCAGVDHCRISTLTLKFDVAFGYGGLDFSRRAIRLGFEETALERGMLVAPMGCF